MSKKEETKDGISRLKLRLTSLQGIPMLMHSVDLADPEYSWTKKCKALNKKDADFEAKNAEFSFIGGAYIDEKEDIILPSRILKGFLKAAGKYIKVGRGNMVNSVKSGIWFETETFPFKHEGPSNVFKYWEASKENKSFISRVMAGVNGSMIPRTRPKFPKWSSEIVVCYDPTIISKENIVDMFNIGSFRLGLGDDIPTHGRFKTEVIG
jgi:hypothetical protein